MRPRARSTPVCEAPNRSPWLALAVLAVCFDVGCTKLKPDGYAPRADAGGADARSCRHATPPDRPDVSPDAGGTLDLIFASRSLDFGELARSRGGEPAWETIGYDLDGTCTSKGGGDSCKEPSWAQIDHPDGLDGRDNGITAATTHIFPGLQLLTDYFSAQPGKQAAILRVRDYDGTSDDSHVQVDFYSGTLWSSRLDLTGPAPFGDERDQWKIGADWLDTPDPPSAPYDTDHSKFRDPDAYVAGGVLVARFEPLLMGDAYLPAPPIHRAILTGELVPAGRHWELRDGVLAGRWQMTDLIRLISYYLVTSNGYAFCTDSPTFTQAKKEFCRYADIRVEGDDPSLPCDGMSMAYSFEAGPASLGPAVSAMPLEKSCSPSTDPTARGCDEGVDGGKAP